MTSTREESWDRLGKRRYDLLVVGAGIIGARIAFEAARAGLSVALVDAGDFGGATSSASSKLIHGGFRYLPMGDLQLVWESQRERRALMGRVAPHLVRPLPMVLAAYRGGPRGPITSAAGLLAYSALCGFRGTGVGLVGTRSARRLVPPLRTEGLSVCGLFEEGQTNDARLVLDTVAAAAGLGATVLNHARVVALEHPQGRLAIASIEGRNGEGVAEVAYRFVINAAGPWVDGVRQLEDATSQPIARLSKGVHLLLETHSEWRAGVVVPVEDGRVTMALPRQGMPLFVRRPARAAARSRNHRQHPPRAPGPDRSLRNGVDRRRQAHDSPPDRPGGAAPAAGSAARGPSPGWRTSAAVQPRPSGAGRPGC